MKINHLINLINGWLHAFRKIHALLVDQEVVAVGLWVVAQADHGVLLLLCPFFLFFFFFFFFPTRVLPRHRRGTSNSSPCFSLCLMMHGIAGPQVALTDASHVGVRVQVWINYVFAFEFARPGRVDDRVPLLHLFLLEHIPTPMAT